MHHSELDLLWWRYVGCHKLSEDDELRSIRAVAEYKELPWKRIHGLFLMSKRWRRLRAQVLARDRMCVECGSKYLLHVDHMKYPKIVGGETLEQLRTLCLECHAKKTKRFDLRAQVNNPRKVVSMKKNRQLFTVLRVI